MLVRDIERPIQNQRYPGFRYPAVRAQAMPFEAIQIVFSGGCTNAHILASYDHHICLSIFEHVKDSARCRFVQGQFNAYQLNLKGESMRKMKSIIDPN